MVRGWNLNTFMCNRNWNKQWVWEISLNEGKTILAHGFRALAFVQSAWRPALLCDHTPWEAVFPQIQVSPVTRRTHTPARDPKLVSISRKINRKIPQGTLLQNGKENPKLKKKGLKMKILRTFPYPRCTTEVSINAGGWSEQQNQLSRGDLVLSHVQV